MIKLIHVAICGFMLIPFVFAQGIDRLELLNQMTSEIPNSIPLYNNEIDKIVYFPLQFDLEKINGIMGQKYDVYSINDGGVYKDDCTYRYNINGGYYIFGVSRNGEMNFIYFRYITNYTIPGFVKLPWTKEYLIEKAGQPKTSYGNDSLELIWYDNAKLKWYRFDFDRKDNLVKGFQIIGPAWEKITR